MKKRFTIAASIMLCMILTQFTAVYAAPMGDLTVLLKSGSGTEVKTYGGFTVSIWQVAAGSPLALTDGFKNFRSSDPVNWSGVDFDPDGKSGDMLGKIADELEKYVNQNKPAHTYRKTTGSDGKAKFEGLEGVYLVMVKDNKSTAEYNFTSFIIQLPLNGNNLVTAIPKGTVPDKGGPGTTDPGKPDTQPKDPEETDPPVPPPPTEKQPPPKPEPILDDDGVPLGEWRWDEDRGEWIFEQFPPLTDLPQTGVLRWPIMVLILIGTQLMFFGWMANRRNQIGYEE